MIHKVLVTGKKFRSIMSAHCMTLRFDESQSEIPCHLLVQFDEEYHNSLLLDFLIALKMAV